MAPDFATKVNGGEDGSSVYPDVMKDVSMEGSDEGKRMGVEVGDTGDVAKEVAVDEVLLGDPKFLTAVVDDGVLVRVTVGNEGIGGSGEEVGEDVG